MQFEAKTFTIPTLDGISEKTIREHLGLYAGYVKHVNIIGERIAEYRKDMATNGYAVAELQRRLGFEWGGMRNHEYYFAQFEGGGQTMAGGPLTKQIEAQWGGVNEWLTRFKEIAATRGVGWAMLYHDPKTNQLVQTWVDEQHLGQLADLDIVLALDMWEHSYMLDYAPSEKKEYIEAFFKNLNWGVVESRLD